MTTKAMVPVSAGQLSKVFDAFGVAQHELDWKTAAIIYAWTTNDSFEEDRGAIVAFANAKLRGMGSAAKVRAYREAYNVAIADGVVPAIEKGGAIVIPTIDFSQYLESTQWRIKQRQQAKPKARSRQQENLERDGHKPGTSKPAPTSKRQEGGPRVSTVRERGERIVQELRAQVKQEQDVGRRAIWEATLSVALNALNSYTKANA